MTAYTLVVTNDPWGDPVGAAIGVFATATEAADYYRSREDLRGFFWVIRQADRPPVFGVGEPLPHIFWTREEIAARLAEVAER